MQTSEILSRLDTLNANVQIYRTNERYIELSDCWGAMIEIGTRDSKITLRARGASFDEALQAAWTLLLPHLPAFQVLLS